MLKLLSDAGIAIVSKSIKFVIHNFAGICLLGSGIALGAWLF